jgi:N utilization substance protein A
VEEGFLSYDDLSIIEPDALMAMGNLSEEDANTIVEQAEERAEVAEVAAAEARRQKREQERLAEMAAEAGMKLAPMDGEGADEETSQGEGEVAEGEATGEGDADMIDGDAAAAHEETSGTEQEPTESTT